MLKCDPYILCDYLISERIKEGAEWSFRCGTDASIYKLSSGTYKIEMGIKVDNKIYTVSFYRGGKYFMVDECIENTREHHPLSFIVSNDPIRNPKIANLWMKIKEKMMVTLIELL